EVLLDFVLLRRQHTGALIVANLLHVLKNTKITKQLLAITYNNASNNRTLTKSLESSLANKSII
ncbi:hypothetical protein BDU57DRAFT_462603, partial [Ampelomyces quisqualis]